jgi:beta-glucanase (GH16 family)
MRYEVRMRADLGQGVSIVALLWPVENVWPPEIDFVEDGGKKEKEKERYS